MALAPCSAFWLGSLNPNARATQMIESIGSIQIYPLGFSDGLRSAIESLSYFSLDHFERSPAWFLMPGRTGLQWTRERIQNHTSYELTFLDLPNVKDEPRPRPARLLRPSVAQSIRSFGFRGVSRRRAGRGRWLWRLVGRFGSEESAAMESVAVNSRNLGFLLRGCRQRIETFSEIH